MMIGIQGLTPYILFSGLCFTNGSYLSEYLLYLGYEVHGIVRRVALEDPTHHFWRLNQIRNQLILHSGSIESFPTLFKIMREVQPDDNIHQVVLLS